ncbi:MAG TPA: hypothetical protein VG268_06230 [Streptosporangiaceae bacterium]|nr:hypothetical protein [Streptosporangiaceae bacterium]
MAGRHWSDLSPRTRRLVIAGAGAEALLKLAVLVDLKRRPAREVRGPKRVWALSMVVNSAGAIPVAYFALGRRRRG